MLVVRLRSPASQCVYATNITAITPPWTIGSIINHNHRQSKKDALFDKYIIQSKAANTISLELEPSALLRALHAAETVGSAGNEDDIVLRLAMHGGRAALVFDIKLARGGGDGAGLGLGYGTRHGQLTKYVRVSVLRAHEVAKIREPQSPMPDVRTYYVYLPNCYFRALSAK